MNTLGDWIRYNANWAGARTALRLYCGEQESPGQNDSCRQSSATQSYTYAELDTAVTQCCHMLTQQLKISHGERLAYLGFNSCELIILLFACARVGATLLPLNNRLALPEHEWILVHSGTSTLFVEDEFLDSARGLEEKCVGLETISMSQDFPRLMADSSVAHFQDRGSLQDRVLLIYTSGTTGKPKGVVHKQEALFYNALNAVHSQEMRALDHVLSVLPLFHSGGLNIQTTPAFYVGAGVTLLRKFDPTDTLKAIQELRPSMFLAVPAVIQAMHSHPLWRNTDLSCLRMVGTGSSTVPDALLNVWHERGIPATQIYGMTESCPTAICLPIADTQSKIGAAGKPAIHCEAKIVDDKGEIMPANKAGEIMIRGPNLLSEYLDDPELTAAAFTDGWFHTGDIGHTDKDGFYYVDDRKKDVIISGGENIYPAELENVLADMPELEQYAVIGRSDARWGEVAVACVVLNSGRQLSESELINRFKGKLARYKHPRGVIYFDNLPRNAMGKVLKFELRAQLSKD